MKYALGANSRVAAISVSTQAVGRVVENYYAGRAIDACAAALYFSSFGYCVDDVVVPLGRLSAQQFKAGIDYGGEAGATFGDADMAVIDVGTE